MNQNFKPFLIFSVTLIFIFFFRFIVIIQFISMILHKSWWYSIFRQTLNVDLPTYFVIRTRLPLILPSTYWSRFLSKWPSNKERTKSLNGLIINTSTTWTQDVHPVGTLTRGDLCFFKSSFPLSVCCERWTSATRIFLSGFWSTGFLKRFAHLVEIHSFIISWSHQAFSRYMTLTRRS